MTTQEEAQYTIDNPYKISESWEAYFVSNTEGTRFMIATTDKHYDFEEYSFYGAGIGLEEISELDCSIVASRGDHCDANVSLSSFKMNLDSAKALLVAEISYPTYEAILNYLRDRAPVDPRAEQLLAEVEA
jgi:hypothetical protein